MFPRSKKSLSAILLLTSLLATEAGATQVVENADRGHVQVNISVNETNRLAIDGRRIANVVPSVKGVLAGQKDEALGAYYFTLASESPNQGTVAVVSRADPSLMEVLSALDDLCRDGGLSFAALRDAMRREGRLHIETY